MKYAIWQLREEHLRTHGFRSLSMIGACDLSHYQRVYAGELEVHPDRADWEVCESLFRTFNLERPADFRGHSMSVSDLVVLDDVRMWFCDSFGFRELRGEDAPVKGSALQLAVTRRAS